ncbi:MAG: hypothetical protein HQL51_03445 [Magnetococcales bacterium]|nr:hypothetical protein [Magnetococcales bacterium]
MDFSRGEAPFPERSKPRAQPGRRGKSENNKRGHKPAPSLLGNYDELLIPLTKEQVIAESKRCMSCGMCFDCDNCYMFCSDSAVIRQPKGSHFKFDWDKCSRCDKCYNQCPCGYIDWVE